MRRSTRNATTTKKRTRSPEVIHGPVAQGSAARIVAIVCVLSLACFARGVSDVHADAEDALARQAEYGVSLALAGDVDDAESVFVSMLSHEPEDARALTNLGNLAFLEADLELAVVYYGMALESAPDDKGIRLNRALALLLRGNDDLARAEAARAMSGDDPGQAFRLLGLKPPSEAQSGITVPSETRDKAADSKTQLTQAEVQELLRSAMRSVRADSSVADSLRVPTRFAPDDTSATRRARRRAWRSAGPRSADQWDPAPWLYWKRD